jgi:hypothetical protein
MQELESLDINRTDEKRARLYQRRNPVSFLFRVFVSRGIREERLSVMLAVSPFGRVTPQSDKRTAPILRRVLLQVL